ncbi:MAG: phage major tail tube protein [Pseudobdellovibrionaceae bacterium]|nr:phage major tail tube protein [Pseudobdellovibrionaceae bacterium]
MKLPKHLKNFNVMFGISDFSAICEEVALPKIKYKTEEWRGAGMAAPIEIDVGLEKLEATFKFGEQTIEGYLSAGVNLSGLITATIFGHIASVDGSSEGITCVLRGWVKGVDPGTWKAGDPKSATQTVEMSVLSWILTRGAVPLITVDVMAGTTLIGAFDQHAAARANLKIG